jgi:hypothetical protein
VEKVPFQAIVDGDRFRSNVLPPPSPRRTRREIITGALFALLVLVGMTASVVLGSGALSSGKA